MTTRVIDKCYCGAPGSKDCSVNYAGRKGKIVEAHFCSDAHQDEFGIRGNMVALFGGTMVLDSHRDSRRSSSSSTDDDSLYDRGDSWLRGSFHSVASLKEKEMIGLYKKHFGYEISPLRHSYW